MKPFCIDDQNAINEITNIKRKMNEKTLLAKLKEESQQLADARHLYFEAQQYSFYSGRSLKVTIINEKVDINNWHQLQNKIERLNRIIKLRFV